MSFISSSKSKTDHKFITSFISANTPINPNPQIMNTATTPKKNPPRPKVSILGFKKMNMMKELGFCQAKKKKEHNFGT